MGQIFDLFIVEGWRSIFRIGIALLKNLESELQRMDMMEMCCFFRDELRHNSITSKFVLFSGASRVRVNTILVIQNSTFFIS